MIKEYFNGITDKRQPGKVKHNLLEIVGMSRNRSIWSVLGPASSNSFPAKISLARKRRRCSYDDAFFADVLRSVHA